MEDNKMPVQLGQEGEELTLQKETFNQQRGIRTMVEEFIRSMLVEGTDYGKIHIARECSNKYNCTNKYHFSKPVLFKAGSEKLLQLANLRATFKLDTETASLVQDTDTIFYICELVNKSGEIVAEGRGACSRNEKRTLNEVVKIGIKRSQVDATLRYFALSDTFTQDLEESEIDIDILIATAKTPEDLKTLWHTKVSAEKQKDPKVVEAFRVAKEKLVDKVFTDKVNEQKI